MGDRPLSDARTVLAGAAPDVAPLLLGATISAGPVVERDGVVGGGVAVRLTEVEAYAGESDPGSHAYRGRTARTAVMFGPAGHAYVYFSYGMHWCLNVVCGPDGEAAAVLVRAGEVVAGVDVALGHRSGSTVRDLARGPARLTKALGIDGTWGGLDLLDPASPLRLSLGPPPDPARVRSGPRVGVAGAGAPTPWRFWLDGKATVSQYRPATERARATRRRTGGSPP